MSKVSVIIPVYGVEKYIERCAKSLFEQTLDDIEFIFVDDCTTDRSMEILNQVIVKYRPLFLEKKYVVRTERMPVNSGLPSVRKYGVQLATGDYIIHCDSDDWVDIDAYKVMYETAIMNESDIVICNYCRTDGNTILQSISGWVDFSSVTLFDDLISKKFTWSLCNKLVRRDLYNNNLVYPVAAMGEDMALGLQLMYWAKSFSHVDKCLYFYYSNMNSISKALDSKKCLNNFYGNLENYRIIESFCIDKGISIKGDSLKYIKWVALRNIWPVIRQSGYKELWEKEFPNLTKFILTNKLVIMSEKIKYFLTIIGLYP